MNESVGKNVAFLLHMYQPPWQYKDMLNKIAKECYIWLTKWISEAKEFKATININYALIELLTNNRLEEIIENIGRGVQNGSIELIGSAAYHPILSLIPEDEVKRQIELNHKKHEEVFNGVWNPRGFFPPEMAYSPRLSQIVKKMGYEWIITEDIVYDPERKAPNNRIVRIYDLPIFFRSNKWSNEFAIAMPNRGDTCVVEFVRRLNESVKDGSYNILAFDMGTIGHHHPEHPYNLETMIYLAKTITDIGMNSVRISDLLDIFPKGEELIKTGKERYKGSWSTEPEHISAGIYYPLWADPNNIIHTIQWELIQHTIKVIKKSKNDPNYQNARDLLDKGLNSCQMWWACEQNWKDRKYILDASKLNLDAVIGLQSVDEEDKRKTSELYGKLQKAVNTIQLHRDFVEKKDKN